MSDSSISMGLDAIFGSERPTNRVETLLTSISLITPSPYQPRKQFSELELQGLSESIQANGVLQPLLVRKQSSGFQLIAGERRLRAAKRAGLTDVPIVICDIDDQSMLAYGLIENIQRADLNPIEEADAYHRLLEEFSLSHSELSKKVGKSRSHITNMVRLINLSEGVKQYLIHSEITMGHARAILGLPIDHQTATAEKVIQHALSVRQTENLVKSILNECTQNISTFNLSQQQKKQLDMWNRDLSNKFSARVKVSVNSKGEGKVLLSTESIDQLEALINLLDP
jgi:ParB family transcriptional regulator, chromosome partitioning protein